MSLRLLGLAGFLRDRWVHSGSRWESICLFGAFMLAQGVVGFILGVGFSRVRPWVVGFILGSWVHSG